MRTLFALLLCALILLTAHGAIAQDTPTVLEPEPFIRSAPDSELPAAPRGSSVPALELEAPRSNDGTVRRVFSVDQDGGVLAEGTLGIGTIPAEGPGYRMMWYPYRGAFRAGTTDDGGAGAYWDDANIGFYSWAGGNLTTASAFASFAFGDQVVVTGVDAASFGAGNNVSGTVGFSTGAYNWCTGFGCLALGHNNRAGGQGSVAVGYRTIAEGNYSVALGHRASSCTTRSFTTVGAEFTCPSGSRIGTFTWADASTTAYFGAQTDNTFNVRAAGGVRFYTNSSTTIGVQVAAGGNSWGTLSDSTRKENLVLAEPVAVLAGLQTLRLGTWNYIGQDPATQRHWGPMAQEFFAAFGRDGYGTVGSDTLITTGDADGVLFAAAQALEARTREQAARIEELEAEVAALRLLRAEVETLRAQTERIAVLEAALTRLVASDSGDYRLTAGE